MSTESDVSEFFERKRAAALLIHLGEDEGGKIVRELGDDLAIAPKTLIDLLEDAGEAKLVTTARKAGDHGNAKRYVLTNEGQVIRDKMDDMGMVETYYELEELRERFDDQESDLLDWVNDEFPAHMKEMYKQDRTREPDPEPDSFY